MLLYPTVAGPLEEEIGWIVYIFVHCQYKSCRWYKDVYICIYCTEDQFHVYIIDDKMVIDIIMC